MKLLRFRFIQPLLFNKRWSANTLNNVDTKLLVENGGDTTAVKNPITFVLFVRNDSVIDKFTGIIYFAVSM